MIPIFVQQSPIKADGNRINTAQIKMKISGPKGTAWIASGLPHTLGITLFFKPKGEVAYRQIERIETSIQTHKSVLILLINKAKKITSD